MKGAWLRIATIAGSTLLLLVGLGAATAAAQEEGAGFEVYRAVTYATRGELELAADIYVPEAEGPLPAVLMVHGGAWTTGHRQMMFLHAMRMVERDFVVMTIDYRLAPEHPFPAQLEDCQEAVRWLRTHAGEYNVDPERIAGYGYSAGGHLVCLLGMMDSPAALPEGEAAAEAAGAGGPEEGGEEIELSGTIDMGSDAATADGEETLEVSTRLQAVVAGGAPCDFTRIPENSDVLAYWLGGTRHDLPEVYRLASPVLYATADDPPVFFFQGEKDLLVWRQSPLSLQRRLMRLGIASQMHIVPGAGHMGAFFDDDAVDAAGDFLDEIFRGIPAPARPEQEAVEESLEEPAAPAAE